MSTNPLGRRNQDQQGREEPPADSRAEPGIPCGIPVATSWGPGAAVSAAVPGEGKASPDTLGVIPFKQGQRSKNENPENPSNTYDLLAHAFSPQSALRK